jgi:hypothetical protein
MAVLSAIASQAGAGVIPRAIHAGVNAVYSEYTITATLSASDLIQFCKIPDGARIVDMVLAFGALSDTGKICIGTRADHDRYIASASLNAAAAFRLNTGVTSVGDLIDISDGAATRYTMIEGRITDNATSASGTTAGVIRLCVQYQMDELATG